MKPSERLRKSLTVDNLWQYAIKALKKPRYAYELTKLLKPLNANMVTVYAVLYKLEAGGYIRKAFSRKGGGPARKYYVATAKGLKELNAAKKMVEKHLKELSA
ncbi:MAG: helix-turn-helix transcriptional regulator [Candidatus Aenigmarchaeota archaeon]|nr:helix-turn-helix transcriptional regulator [Candidatus Aenigmarchaeota archaeon]